MKELLQLYLGICIAALAFKYGIRALNKLRGKSISDKHDHEDEHAQGHLIKLLILLLLAALLFFVLKGNSYKTPSSVSLNDAAGKMRFSVVPFCNDDCIMLNKEQNVQECDATGLHSSNAAQFIKNKKNY